MAEVLVEFDTTIIGADGTRWTPRACGAVADDGLWEGWIEFTPLDASVGPIRTSRETEQPNRDDLMYWAQGLTQTYLDGALQRALRPAPSRPVARDTARPYFEGPAPRFRADATATPRPVLDPFDVYRQGEYVLVRTLAALDVARLRDIVVGFGLRGASVASGMSRDELTEAILAAVREPPNRELHKGRDFVI